MQNRITSAGTDVDSEPKVEVTTSCPNNGNTIVSGILQRPMKFRYDFYGVMKTYTLYEIMYGWVEKSINHPENYCGEFTGLIYKKDIEVYEGDVIRVENKVNRVILKNGFQYYAFKLPNPETDEMPFPIGHYKLHKDVKWKLIGNIFHNSELLG